MNTVRPQKLRRIAQELRERFDATPLGDAMSKPIAESLELQAEVLSRRNPPSVDLTSLVSKAEALLDLIPESISDRSSSVCGLRTTTSVNPRVDLRSPIRRKWPQRKRSVTWAI
jgi:hypothetical protein